MDIMDFIGEIVKQGVWAILFVWLLIDGNKKATEREQKYVEQIEKRDSILNDMKNAIILISEKLK